MGDWLDIIDRLDVPTLFVVFVYAAYKGLGMMNSISTSLQLVEQRLSQVDDKVTVHMAADLLEHKTIRDELTEVKINVASNASKIGG